MAIYEEKWGFSKTLITMPLKEDDEEKMSIILRESQGGYMLSTTSFIFGAMANMPPNYLALFSKIFVVWPMK